MSIRRLLLAATALSCFAAFPAMANEISVPVDGAPKVKVEAAKVDDKGDNFIPKEQWDKLSPEERKKIRAERKAKWEAMTPEEKEKRRAEMKERYKNASPEEKAKIRHRMEERHAHMREKFEKLPPQEREKFLKDHPGFADRMAKQKEMAGKDGKEPVPAPKKN
jgi:hypothetical protein